MTLHLLLSLTKMVSLISDANKASIDDAFNSIHDTFRRPIKAFKDGKRVIVSSNPNYNHIYGNRPKTSNVRYEESERLIYARIFYFAGAKPKTPLDATKGDDLKLSIDSGEVRLKMSNEDFNWLGNVNRIEFDSKIFQVISDEIPHGMFTSSYKMLILRSLD